MLIFQNFSIVLYIIIIIIIKRNYFFLNFSFFFLIVIFCRFHHLFFNFQQRRVCRASFFAHLKINEIVDGRSRGERIGLLDPVSSIFECSRERTDSFVPRWSSMTTLVTRPLLRHHVSRIFALSVCELFRNFLLQILGYFFLEIFCSDLFRK